jgi:hypothetical protein
MLFNRPTISEARGRVFRPMAVSTPFQFTKNYGSSKLMIGFPGEYLYIVFGAFSPIFPTGIDEINNVSITHYPLSSSGSDL